MSEPTVASSSSSTSVTPGISHLGSVRGIPLESQLYRIFAQKVFEGVIGRLKSNDRFDVATVQQLEQRWSEELRASGCDIFSTSVHTSNLATTISAADAETSFRFLKRMRHYVPPLPLFRNPQGYGGEPFLVAETPAEGLASAEYPGAGVGVKLVYSVKTDASDAPEVPQDTPSGNAVNRDRRLYGKKGKRGLVLSEILHAETHPITYGTKVKIKSTTDDVVRVGRAVSFPERDILRVRYGSGFEELVSYEHSEGVDEALDYSKIGVQLEGDVDSILENNEGGDGVMHSAQFLHPRDEEGIIRALGTDVPFLREERGERNVHSFHTMNLVPSSSSLLPQDERTGQVLLTGSTGAITYTGTAEDLQKFRDIEKYFECRRSKPVRVTLNRVIGDKSRFSESERVDVNNESLPVLSAEEDPELYLESTSQPNLIIGHCAGRVFRRATDWTVVLKNAIVTMDNEDRLFSSLSLKVDPTNITGTGIQAKSLM